MKTRLVPITCEWSNTHIPSLKQTKLFSLNIFQVISCDLHFTNDVLVKNMTVSTSISPLDDDGVLINALNMSALGSQAVLTTSDSFSIDGHKVFIDGFAAENLDVAGEKSSLAQVM